MLKPFCHDLVLNPSFQRLQTNPNLCCCSTNLGWSVDVDKMDSGLSYGKSVLEYSHGKRRYIRGFKKMLHLFYFYGLQSYYFAKAEWFPLNSFMNSMFVRPKFWWFPDSIHVHVINKNSCICVIGEKKNWSIGIVGCLVPMSQGGVRQYFRRGQYFL